MTTGLRSHRALRIADPEAPDGWRWVDLATYAKGLTATDYQAVIWPHQEGDGRTVWVRVVTTVVRNLYRAQVIIVRDTLDGKVSDVRFWASSDLRADVPTLISHLAARFMFGTIQRMNLGAQRVYSSGHTHCAPGGRAASRISA
jgi:hypothetical protein